MSNTKKAATAKLATTAETMAEEMTAETNAVETSTDLAMVEALANTLNSETPLDPTPARPMDAFDNLDALAMPQSFDTMIAVEKLWTSIACDKPGPQTFFRTSADPTYQRPMCCVKDKRPDKRGEIYLIHPDVLNDAEASITLENQKARMMIYAWVDRQDRPRLWAVPLDTDNAFHKSAHQAAAIAVQRWIKIEAVGGAYEAKGAKGKLPEPDWSKVPSFNELMRLCFKERFIHKADHPFLAELAGYK